MKLQQSMNNRTMKQCKPLDGLHICGGNLHPGDI